MLSANDGTGTSGYVAIDPTEEIIVVSFAGTENAATWIYKCVNISL